MTAVSSSYDPVKYKISSIQNWNSFAPSYHDEWANKSIGPFGSTAELVKAAEITPSDRVLDVACGTGVVSAQVSKRLGPAGMLVGIDFARKALEISRSTVQKGHFIEMDAEHIGINAKFDRIVCQYALMFFPDPASVLSRLFALLGNGGRLAVAVHGSKEGTPYFTSIMEPVLKHIPDIRPDGTPTVHRFGRAQDLKATIAEAGFSEVTVKELVFYYEAGTFQEYWTDYISSTANSIRSTIEGKGADTVSAIKAEAKKRAERFLKNGTILFPWHVLIASGTHAQD